MRHPNNCHFFASPGSERSEAGLTLAFISGAATALLLSTMPAQSSAKIEIEGQSDALSAGRSMQDRQPHSWSVCARWRKAREVSQLEISIAARSRAAVSTAVSCR
jgi:hypothetical protein